MRELIGDGDHGINMAKGFTGCGTRLDALGARALDLPAALEQLSLALMDDIGGSMGPLYGNFFSGFVDTLAPHEELDAALFGDALAAYQETMVDGRDFAAALQAMRRAAEKGKDSTRDLQARIGRSARLGPRSIGVLDAGATSCCLILQTMSRSLQRQFTA